MSTYGRLLIPETQQHSTAATGLIRQSILNLSEVLVAMQMLGMHGTVFANFAVDQSDLLLAFGVRFDDRVTGKLETFAANAKIVHIDIDPAELNKNKESFITVTGFNCSSAILCVCMGSVPCVMNA